MSERESAAWVRAASDSATTVTADSPRHLLLDRCTLSRRLARPCGGLPQAVDQAAGQHSARAADSLARRASAPSAKAGLRE